MKFKIGDRVRVKGSALTTNEFVISDWYYCMDGEYRYGGRDTYRQYTEYELELVQPKFKVGDTVICILPAFMTKAEKRSGYYGCVGWQQGREFVVDRINTTSTTNIFVYFEKGNIKGVFERYLELMPTIVCKDIKLIPWGDIKWNIDIKYGPEEKNRQLADQLSEWGSSTYASTPESLTLGNLGKAIDTIITNKKYCDKLIKDGYNLMFDTIKWLEFPFKVVDVDDCNNLDMMRILSRSLLKPDLEIKYIEGQTPQPLRSFVKAGITTKDGILTTEGLRVFASWLLNKYGVEFKEDVVDEIIKKN